MLSKYRYEIFGMAAVGVIAVHGQEAAYAVPLIQKLLHKVSGTITRK